MRAVIFSGGNIDNYEFTKQLLKSDDLIIAADSGFDHLKELGIIPDIFIGDMDSVQNEVLAKEVIKLEVMKDETDTEAAVRLAVKKGAEKILIFGGIGTRLDHTMANILLLKSIFDMGISASIIDSHNEIFYLKDKISITGKTGDTLSIIPLSDMFGATTSGLFYKLKNDELKFGSSRGVSNVMTDDSCEITVTSGEALVIKSRD